MPAPSVPAAPDRRFDGRLVHPDSQVLVAPAVSWTLGDQDALDTYLRLTTGPVEVVVASSDAVVDPPRSRRVAVHVLPDLVAGASRSRRSDVAAYDALLACAAHCTVLAPDADPVGRSTAGLAAITRPAAARGLDTRILGFAWPAAPDQRTVRMVRSAVRAGTTLHVNEDLDRIRAMNDGVTGMRRAVDLRFGGTGTGSSTADPERLVEEPFALVDVSAVGPGGADPIADVIGVTAHLQRRGVNVLLIPQDPTTDGDDRALCERVSEVLGHQHVQVLGRALHPDELRALAARAHVVVTGRGSLTILALTCATPVVGVAGERAVAGVLRLVGVHDGCVQPRRGFASAVRRLVDRIIDDRPAATATIRRALPELVGLASGNLDGLPLCSAPGGLRTRRSA